MTSGEGKYQVIRTGASISVDTKNVESDCNQITFFNFGDTPVTISGRDDGGLGISFTLLGQTATKTDYMILGTLNPDLWEVTKYDITFGTEVTTKQLAIMRVKLLK